MSVEPRPFAYLRALTRDAENAVQLQLIPIEVSPFRVGRESRGPNAERPSLTDRTRNAERRAAGFKPNNEVYLLETTREVYVSREHFEIRREKDGFLLVDRQSALGTWVEGELIGGNRAGGQARLRDGDVIFVGSYRSGFIFKFIVDDEALDQA
jgi:hypothetical protein